jgi:hypothetical protein
MENENLLEVESGCCCSQPPSLAGSYSYHLCDSCKVHDGEEFWIKKQQFCNTNNSTMWVG